MTPFPEPLTDRYRRFKHRHFEPNIEQYEELATYGQSPDVMIVSCCDSRVDPETIFSAMPGELFVMRNVANLIPPYETGGTYHGVSAAIEFAVLNLRVKHLVIMGHSGCGGIKAALDREAARETEGQFITKWMSMLEAARLKVLASHQGSSRKDMAAALEREGDQDLAQEPAHLPLPQRAGGARAASRCTGPISTSRRARSRRSTSRRASSTRCDDVPSPRLRGEEDDRSALAGRRLARASIAGISFSVSDSGVTAPTCLNTISPLPLTTNVSGMP